MILQIPVGFCAEDLGKEGSLSFDFTSVLDTS